MDKKIEIYYDGSCRICTAGVEKVMHSSHGRSFEHKDVSSGALPEGISKEATMKEMHVIDGSGTLYKGAAGALRILEEYPRWRWLARVGRLPLIYPFVSLGYKIVAANRHRFK